MKAPASEPNDRRPVIINGLLLLLLLVEYLLMRYGHADNRSTPIELVLLFFATLVLIPLVNLVLALTSYKDRHHERAEIYVVCCIFSTVAVFGFWIYVVHNLK